MAYDIYKETQEAIDAGERALSSLRAAQKELSSTRNWGIYDMLGDGFISTLIKHNKMDSAQGYMEQAKYDLSSFSKELRDVSNYIIDAIRSRISTKLDPFITKEAGTYVAAIEKKKKRRYSMLRLRGMNCSLITRR